MKYFRGKAEIHNVFFFLSFSIFTLGSYQKALQGNLIFLSCLIRESFLFSYFFFGGRGIF